MTVTRRGTAHQRCRSVPILFVSSAADNYHEHFTRQLAVGNKRSRAWPATFTGWVLAAIGCFVFRRDAIVTGCGGCKPFYAERGTSQRLGRERRVFFCLLLMNKEQNQRLPPTPLFQFFLFLLYIFFSPRSFYRYQRKVSFFPSMRARSQRCCCDNYDQLISNTFHPSRPCDIVSRPLLPSDCTSRLERLILEKSKVMMTIALFTSTILFCFCFFFFILISFILSFLKGFFCYSFLFCMSVLFSFSFKHSLLVNIHLLRS